MTEDISALSPAERAQKLLGKLNLPEPQQEPQFDEALIPKLDDVHFERSDLDLEVDRIMDSISIIEAYRRWCGKMEPVVGKRKESIMISCPVPGHADTNPSAWMNKEKGTWYCGACQQGGDKFDLAAWNYGYPVPGYKTNGDFPTLRKHMAQEFGLQTVKSFNGREYPLVSEPEQPLAKVIPLAVNDDAPVPTLESYEEKIAENIESLTIDWEKLVKPGTFLWDWMHACTIDDLPHEYYFWMGLQAIGFAGDNDVKLLDSKPVKPNLNVCLYGPTGGGKSRSITPYSRLLKQALPFKLDDIYTDPEGVLFLSSPGSAEALIDSLHHETFDINTNQIDHLAPVTGLLKFEEFASFMAKAGRMGSSLKEVMIELYDISEGDEVTTNSRTSGNVKAYSPFLQALTTTQPNAIHGFLKRIDSESGFLNRWVFAAGAARVAPISYGVAQADIDVAADQLIDLKKWCERRHEFVLDGPAFKAWDKFFHKTFAPQRTGAEQLDSIQSRIELILKKLIVLFTINEKLSQPTAKVVEQAVSLYDYLVASYSLITGDISQTDRTACEERIIEVVKKHQEKFAGKSSEYPTKHDIRRAIGKKFDLETINRTLKTLLEAGVVEEVIPPPKPVGRPSGMRYYVGN